MSFVALLFACLVQKAPEPSPAEQQEAERTLRSIFEADYSKRGRAESVILAKRLMKASAELEKEPVVMFVALREACVLAARGGDVEVSFAAVDKLAERFDVDELALKMDALDLAGIVPRSPQEARSLTARWEGLADLALRLQRYEEASKCLSKASLAARSSRDRETIARLKERAAAVDALAVEHRKWKAAEQTLETKPDDPAALLAAGRFLCLFLGDWERGLERLVRCTHQPFREAARGDLARPTDPGEQVRAGDAWWELAQDERNAGAKARLLERAASWYGKAHGKVKGLTRIKIEKRLSEIGRAAPAKGFPGKRSSVALIDDFEGGVRRWKPYGSESGARIEESSEARIGRKAAKLSLEMRKEKDNPRVGMKLSGPPPPGTRGISLWARSLEGVVTIRFYIRQGPGGGKDKGVNYSFHEQVGPEWKFIEVPFDKMDPWSPSKPIPKFNLSRICGIDAGRARKERRAVYLVDHLSWVGGKD